MQKQICGKIVHRITPCLFGYLRRAVLLPVFLVFAYGTSAQGIRGYVLDGEGNPLSYATIFIHETGSGATSNVNGRYEIPLPPGTYRIDFRHLGHKTSAETVTIQDNWVQRDIVMPEQAYTLLTAEIHAGDEDPAYTIMRRVIAKSAYFRNQVDRYTCRVYLKGSGRLTDYPWFAKPIIKQEGIDTAAAFTSESITEVTYTRPNKYEEKVIRIRTTGSDQNPGHLNYINGSFYEEEIAGQVSPLSKKAFAHYRFRYLGTYREGDRQIEKIQVIPRLNNEELFSGEVHIVDGLWNIHNLNFTIRAQGITLHVVQDFAPIRDDVWLPVSHRYFGEGKMMGFEFEFNYLASVSGYEVEVNEALAADFTLLDEKIDEAPYEEPPAAIQSEETPSVQETGIRYDTLTTRQLRKIIREYAKEERQKSEEPHLISERNTSVDSAAATSDPEFWNRIRPVPLTLAEEKGYKLMDSLAVARGEMEDTTGSQKFSVAKIFIGGQYRLGKGQTLRIHSPPASLRFNTVDGFNGQYRVTYENRFTRDNILTISPTFRYAHSRDKGTGYLTAGYQTGDALKRTTITASGGTSFRQFNRDEPISTFTNTISSLFVEKNYMKIYDRNYGEVAVTRRLGALFQLGIGAEYNHRRQTHNTTNQTWYDREDIGYTSNEPKNLELEDTGFGRNDAFLVEGSLSWFPTDRYRRTNNRTHLIPSGTEFNLFYRKAVAGPGEATADFDFLSLEAKHNFTLGVFGELRVRTEGGKFLTKKEVPFMDYAHFMGNQTIFTRFSYMDSYSILPYYDYSTGEEYLSTYANLQLNRFLLSQFYALRATGLSEYIVLNHLITPSVNHYVELGYSVGNIFRLFRIDATAAFLDGQYTDFRVQVGISSEFFRFED